MTIPRPIALLLLVAALGWWAVCRLSLTIDRARSDWDDDLAELLESIGETR